MDGIFGLREEKEKKEREAGGLEALH